MTVHRRHFVVSLTLLAWLASGAAQAQFTQPQLREFVREGLRDDSIRHGPPLIDYSARDRVEINLGWVELSDPDPLWAFPYSDQCLVELIRAHYAKNPGELQAWQPYLKQAETLIAKEIALIEAYEKEHPAKPAAEESGGRDRSKSSAPRPGSKAIPSPPSLKEAAPAPPAPSAPRVKNEAPAPPAPGADEPLPPPAPGAIEAPAPDDDFSAAEPAIRDFPSWPQLEGDIPFEEMEISRALNDISYGVERALLARIDAEAARQQKVVRLVEQPRGAGLPVHEVLVRTLPPGASVYYLNELAFARYSRGGAVDKVDQVWLAVAGGSVQLAGKWRFVAVWPDGRRSAMSQYHIIKDNAIELVPEARAPAPPQRSP